MSSRASASAACRCAWSEIINHFGSRLRHTVVALDGDFAAARSLADNLDVAFLPIARSRRGLVGTLFHARSRLSRLRPDLLITYNWGAIEWAMANRLLPVARQLHFEAGFGAEEADAQFRRRVVFRRWALARCARVVVPSRGLEDLARRVWKLPPDRVCYVPNGVDPERFSHPVRDMIPGFTRRPGELVIGTVAPLRPEKNVGRLLRAFAGLDRSMTARLIVAGDGAERPGLIRLAAELGVADRVVFPGQVAPEIGARRVRCLCPVVRHRADAERIARGDGGEPRGGCRRCRRREGDAVRGQP